MTQSDLDLHQLAEAVKGRVIGPDDSDYDEARTIFYGGFDRRPGAIVRVADADDVSRVVTRAAETGTELAVRSGGHSLAGHSVSEGGLVLDLSNMRALDIDPGARTAWAETRAHHRGVHPGGGRPRPGHRIRGHRNGGGRRHHPERRDRLPGP